jgi:hypothetical protein
MAVDRVFERKRAWLMIDLRHHMYSVDAMNRCDGNPQVFSPLFFFCILKIKLNPNFCDKIMTNKKKTKNNKQIRKKD